MNPDYSGTRTETSTPASSGSVVDVGFARGILEPIPFGPGHKQEQSGWSFRVVEEGSELVLQNASKHERDAA